MNMEKKRILHRLTSLRNYKSKLVNKFLTKSNRELFDDNAIVVKEKKLLRRSVSKVFLIHNFFEIKCY